MRVATAPGLREAPDDDGHWVTMNGEHLFIKGPGGEKPDGAGNGSGAAGPKTMHATTAEGIADHLINILPEDGHFAVGLRGLHQGEDNLGKSYVWKDGSRTSVRLPGTSVVGVVGSWEMANRSQLVSGITRALDLIGQYNFSGRVAVVVGDKRLGDQAHASDVGEYLLRNAKIVGLLPRVHTESFRESAAPNATFPDAYRAAAKHFVADARGWWAGLPSPYLDVDHLRPRLPEIQQAAQQFAATTMGQYVGSLILARRLAYATALWRAVQDTEALGVSVDGLAHAALRPTGTQRIGTVREAASFREEAPIEDGHWVTVNGAHIFIKTGGAAYETGVTLTKSDERAFHGQPEGTKGGLTKQKAGKLAENIVIQWLRQRGMKDAGPMNLTHNNFPVDLVQDHKAIEVKSGLASNGKSAQQWRLTIGEPGKAEQAWLRTASSDEKASWNADKQSQITARKEAIISAISSALGHEVKAQTITVILHPDKQLADIHVFDGFHNRIGWQSDQARSGYVGTVKYATK